MVALPQRQNAKEDAEMDYFFFFLGLAMVMCTLGALKASTSSDSE